ncbi:MAG: hypothetical protein ACNI3A_10265 [Desulfovibrio sp.]|uniref:hypothetical protein n=1 Tax=Desulfovibrio sp. 7SRBS1 TaxID=3378064 RepID=UPI003B3C06D4
MVIFKRKAARKFLQRLITLARSPDKTSFSFAPSTNPDRECRGIKTEKATSDSLLRETQILAYQEIRVGLVFRWRLAIAAFLSSPQSCGGGF